MTHFPTFIPPRAPLDIQELSMPSNPLRPIQNRVDLLRENIKAIRPDFKEVSVMERWYRFSTKAQDRIAYLDVSHGAHQDGFLPDEVNQIVEKLGLVPARLAEAELRVAGYTDGMPNEANEAFYGHKFWRKFDAQQRVPGSFHKDCYAARFKGDSPESPDTLVMIALPSNDGSYFDSLTYQDRAHGALFRLLEEQGIPVQWNSIGGMGREHLLEAAIGYHLPRVSGKPTLRDLCNKLAAISGIKRIASREFNLSASDLPNFKHSDEYLSSIRISLRNYSEVVRERKSERAALDYINSELKRLGCKSRAGIRSTNGPSGNNYISLSFGYYCAEEQGDTIYHALNNINGVRSDPTNSASYLVDLSQISELERFGDKAVPLHVYEQIEGVEMM